MSSLRDVLRKASKKIEHGDREGAARLLDEAGEILAARGIVDRAARVYVEAAKLYREYERTSEYFDAVENATLMLVRQGCDSKTNVEIIRINEEAGDFAEESEMYQRAADFYFRAMDFATGSKSLKLTVKAADALENLADEKEVAEDTDATLTLLKKVSRLYYTAGDDELGKRINERAIRLALSWAEEAQQREDWLSAGNLIAEAAQITQTEGDNIEATRLMMDAGVFYEKIGLHEKAGNIFDAAQETYKLERLSSARKNAMSQAAEAYMKMDGKPEVVAPLLVKAGDMFEELGRVMKAKWSYKKAGEIFEELAQQAAEDGDTPSEKNYLRYQAMCLRNWGAEDKAEAIYKAVIDYFIGQAAKEEKMNHHERQALSLEEAADVMYEAGLREEAEDTLERALDIYVGLAKERAASDEPDEESRLYSEAADCASKMGDTERSASFHRKASERAKSAGELYQEMGVGELATIWLRTAGMEALKTGEPKMYEKAIEYLLESAEGFRDIDEEIEAFDDLFAVFSILLEHKPDDQRLSEVLSAMDEIGLTTRDETVSLTLSVVRPLFHGNHIAALLALQESEEELEAKADRLRELVYIVKKRAR
ncbi:hypothetical protein EU546_03925 [Candidatus Thorarchaeota archaeon]|nr:MAG: hypothetical protein EU546_03925 [Candidatus Thorarchaeota archaeon]